MKKNKNTLKRTFGTLVFSLLLFTVAISCAAPDNPTNNNMQGQEDQKAQIEAKRLQKKIEIYNNMLGTWESTKGGIISNYHSYEDSADYSPEVLHIESTRWFWSKKGQEDVVFQVWDKPFYNYIYLYDEWMADDFIEKKEIEKYFENPNNKKYWTNDSIKNNVIFLFLKNFKDKNISVFFTATNDLPTVLNVSGFHLKRSPASENGNENQGGEAGSNSEAEKIDLSGSWNYEIPGQVNAGGTVSFENGTIKFKHKVGSLISEASYTLSGDVMTIEYMSFKETFKIKKESSTITIAYTGSESISQVLGGFFQYINTDNKIKMTKN